MKLKHRVATVLFALFCGSWVVYGPITSLLPGIEPTPWLTMALGLLSLLIAGALWFRLPWARWPAIILMTVLIVLPGAAYLINAFAGAGWNADTLVGFGFSGLWLLLELWVVYVLVAEWPGEPATDPAR